MDLYIGAYWGQRKQSADECAERLIACLKGLEATSSAFESWFRRGKSKQAALQQPVDPSDYSGIVGLLESGRNKRDTDRSVIEDLGFSVGLWNGTDGDRSASMSVACGVYSPNPHLRNSVVLDFPKQLDELGSRESALNALIAVVEAWKPDWAGIISRASRTARPFSPGSPFVDWMFYRSGLTLAESELPPSASAIRVSNLGSIVVTQNDPVDATNETHVQNVHAIETMIPA